MINNNVIVFLIKFTKCPYGILRYAESIAFDHYSHSIVPGGFEVMS